MCVSFNEVFYKVQITDKMLCSLTLPQFFFVSVPYNMYRAVSEIPIKIKHLSCVTGEGNSINSSRLIA